MKNKFTIDEDNKIILNDVKSEIEKLKSKYELLTKQENEYIQKLKETRKLDLNNLDNNNNDNNNKFNKIIKNKINDKEKKIPQIKNIRRNLNDNDENYLTNISKKENNKSINEIYSKVNINNNQNNPNKIVNRSKSNIQKKIALTSTERAEKKKELIEKIKVLRNKSKSKLIQSKQKKSETISSLKNEN